MTVDWLCLSLTPRRTVTKTALGLARFLPFYQVFQKPPSLIEMAVCQLRNRRQSTLQSNESSHGRVQDTHASNVENDNELSRQVSANHEFKPRALLFINHYTGMGSLSTHRPDRSTVGSHVQRVIRRKKRMSTEFKLRPVMKGGVRSGFFFGRVKTTERPLLQSQRPPYAKKDCYTVYRVGKGPRPVSVKVRPQKNASSNKVKNKASLTMLRSPSSNHCELGTKIGDIDIRELLTESRVTGTIFCYCELWQDTPSSTAWTNFKALMMTLDVQTKRFSSQDSSQSTHRVSSIFDGPFNVRHLKLGSSSPFSLSALQSRKLWLPLSSIVLSPQDLVFRLHPAIKSC